MKEIIAFFLSGKEYGVEVSNMQGLENYKEITPLDGMPGGVLGVVDFRGETVPVYDIKKRLILPPAPVTAETKFLVFRTIYGRLACLADGVSRIFRIEDKDVRERPSLVHSETTDYIDFVARKDDKLVVVISPGNLLTEEDWIAVKKLTRKRKEEAAAEKAAAEQNGGKEEND